MNIRKIVFLVELKFSLRDYQRFGIETLQQNGFEVEVWNFTPFLHSKAYYEIQVPDKVFFSGHRIFNNKKEATNAISNLDKTTLIICLIDYRLDTYTIFKAITKKKLVYCMFVANYFPKIPATSNIRSFLNSLKGMNFVKLCNSFFSRIPFYIWGIKPVDFLLAGGSSSLNMRFPINAKTEVFWLHSLDYDIYLKERTLESPPEDRMGVFLDQLALSHPDDKFLKIKTPLSPEEYYPLLCDFFDLLKKRYGFDIVIAAHPRSNCDEYMGYFKDRPVIKGRTAELVKKAKFIIAHSSTSVNFAVLFKKPVIFITTNKYQRWEGINIDLLASLLRKETINLDKEIIFDLKKELEVDEGAYARYKEHYIKTNASAELPFWQIFANRIKDIKYA